jgi:uncharacterized protein (TIGR02452 family)
VGDYVPKPELIEIANHTLDILKEGFYINDQGVVVSIKNSLLNAIKNTTLYMPVMETEIKEQAIKAIKQSKVKTTIIEVTEETSLQAISRLDEEGAKNITCLNFASARTPGGGFLKGANAQEESLARSSGLHPCISQMQLMYDHNRNLKSCMYSDYMIYSPNVPVIKDDQGKLVVKPIEASFITSPAVNAGVVRSREMSQRYNIDEVMIGRIEKILSIAATKETKTLILGAFGCGVFKNDPVDVAEYFKGFITGDGAFAHCFERIVFAVYDPTINKVILNPFKTAFQVKSPL